MKVGTNSFVWMPQDLYAPFDCIRLYNDMDFIQNERGLYTFAPTKKNTDFNYDTVIGNLSAQGKTVLLTTHKKAQWLGTGKFESKPLETGANPEDPMSYAIFSQHLFQQQVRYGKKAHPIENIKTFTGTFYGVYKNEPLSGLAYNFKQMPLNETNADWWTLAEYWTPKQLAAVWSAVWDGHGGRIPLGGIMNADPEAFIVFPSLAYGTRKGLTIRQYVQEFLNEFWKLRPELANVIPFHAIGINFYCRKNNIGVDPFDSELYNEFTWWKQQYKMPVYLTEFGYDEITGSKQCPVAYPGKTILETKNEMIKRGILLAKAAGVDEFYIYQIRDEAPADAGLYRTCGMVTTSQTGYQKKASYIFMEGYTLFFKGISTVEKVGATTLKIDEQTWTFNLDGTATQGTPPPSTPTSMIIGFSTKADRSDFVILSEAKNLAAGNYYIEARQATPTVSFSLKKDGVVVKTQNENGAPYDMAGGSAYNFTTGDYELTVKDKTTPAGVVISFTVGTVAPPPPPPPAKEPVTETWIENGKVFFKTAVKTYSTPVQ